MVSGIRNLVLHPDVFFERLSKEKVSLLRPFLIIFSGALVFVIIIILFFIWNRTGWHFSILMVGPLAQHIILSLTSVALMMPFIYWALVAVIFYGISRACKGTGSFSMTLQNTGYGMFPWSVSAALPLAAYLHKFFTYTGGPVSGGYTGIWMMPAGLGQLPLILIFIWSGFLWVPAIQFTHGFTRRKAMIIVWVPVLTYILLTLPCIAWFWYL
jgi:hypothetical protein